MNICFIGGGNMATALIGGLLKSGNQSRDIQAKPEDLRVVEINVENRARLQHEFGVLATADMAEGVAGSEVIVLAVKPQQLYEVAAQLAPLLTGQLILSIAAGIRAADLARWLGTQNVVRAMPNTPALVQSGISGWFALAGVNPMHFGTADAILKAVGEAVRVPTEEMLDAVTAISGSGPAYVFYFIEAMQQAACELGFNDEAARKLSIHTFLGATKLAQNSTDDVSVLRARVTSKNGTTERALLSLEANNVKQQIITAARAAAARSKEMGDELGGAN